MPLQREKGSYPSSLPTAVARSDGEEPSKLQLPCRTSAMVRISCPESISRQAVETNTCYLLKVARRVNPQHLDCNFTAHVFALPNVSVPAMIERGVRSIVAEWDF